ncbi:hypothetical protein ACFYTQ_35465 [Nocardia sp. NPDC004068]|uniref:hypothetical protein n=1 Tax=Nocardia sp. NPDC004068 TaxID=3364303 RepID=UPI00368E24B9
MRKISDSSEGIIEMMANTFCAAVVFTGLIMGGIGVASAETTDGNSGGSAFSAAGCAGRLTSPPGCDTQAECEHRYTVGCQLADDGNWYAHPLDPVTPWWKSATARDEASDRGEFATREECLKVPTPEGVLAHCDYVPWPNGQPGGRWILFY